MFIAGTMVIVDINSNYASSGVDMSIDQYIENLNNLSGVANSDTANNYTGDMNTFVLGGEVNVENTADSMFSGSFSGIRLITTPISLFKIITADIAINLGIPTVFVNFAFTALFISIIFTIIYIVFRISKST